MASETRPLGLIGLAKPLSVPERSRLDDDLRRLLRFSRSLRGFPRIRRAPNATPIVAIYGRGHLLGCALSRRNARGSDRLARSFLAASAQVGLSEEAHDLATQVTYARTFRWVDDAASIEVGTEGVALVGGDHGPVLLMPQVARDAGVDAEGFIGLLRQKAGGRVQGGRLGAWTAERVVARLSKAEDESREAARETGATDRDYAAAWLARLVQPDGSMAFAIDPVRRILQPCGELHHIRTAIAIEALAKHAGYSSEVARARRFLSRQIERALLGETIPAWPAEPHVIAGTLGLALWAGIDVRAPLLRFASRRDLRKHPWQAAQVALGLGAETPVPLWEACIGDLARTPFAPWTTLAARAVGDERGYRRAAAALAGCLARTAPHEGGARVTPVPETGLTAVAAHALLDSTEHRAVAKKALAFVRARQLLPGAIPAALDPRLALGAFSATPVNDALRADIVGHALSALLDHR